MSASNSTSPSRRRKPSSPSRNPRPIKRQPAPIPSLASWQPKPIGAFPPSRLGTLPLGAQLKLRNAHEALRNREQMVWISAAWGESMCATRTELERMVAVPGICIDELAGTTWRQGVGGRNNVAGKSTGKFGSIRGGTTLWRDLKWGDRVPKEILERIRLDELGVGSDEEEDDQEEEKKKKKEGEGDVEMVDVESKSGGKGKEMVTGEGSTTAKRPIKVEDDEVMNVDNNEEGDDDDDDEGGVPIPPATRKRRARG